MTSRLLREREREREREGKPIVCHLHGESNDAEAITGPGFCLGRAASDSDSPPPAGQWEHAAKEDHQKKWPSMRWTLTTGVASNLYERLGTRLAANLMHGILLLEAIQGAIKTKGGSPKSDSA